MSHKVLSYDLGGTKIAAAVVTPKGKILDEVRTPAVFSLGKKAVLQQLADIGQELLKQHRGIKKIGMASAGPLDMYKGVLLDPTNFSNAKEGTWGKVPITQILKKKLRLPVYLENDAAAAILAEHWIGATRKYKNSMVLTLGTGLGTGIICNGELLRAGRLLHPEAGHIPLNFQDRTAPCGCGNFGCAEAYLSGKNFTHRMRVRLNRPGLSAKDFADLARSGDPGAQAGFEDYGRQMAAAINCYARLYCPQIIVFTGSFAEASDLFIPVTQKYLKVFMARVPELYPKMAVSTLHNRAGLIGGAYVAFHRGKGTLTL